MRYRVVRQVTYREAWLPPETTAFLASYTCTASGVYAVTATVDDAGFTALVFFLLTLGYLSSFAARMEHVWWGRMVKMVGTIVGLGSVPVLSIRSSAASILPAEALVQPDLRTAVLLAWIAVIVSFLVGSFVLNHWVPMSFPIVPTLSMFGLIATMNPNVDILIAFMVFLCAGIFLVSYENTLRRLPESLWKAARLKTISYQHLALAGGFFVPVMVCAIVLAFTLQIVTPPIFVSRVYRMRSAMMNSMLQRWTSFYNTFDLRVGGYALSNAPQMRVYAQEGFNWRGRVYNRYERSQWQRALWDQEGVEAQRNVGDRFVFSTEVPRHHRVVSAEFECIGYLPPVLYSPGIPLRVEYPRSRLHLDATNCLVPGSMVLPGTYYRVWAAVPKVEEEIDALRNAEGYCPEALRNMYYLSVPHEANRLKALAQSIIQTKNIDRPFPKAEALMDYLQRNCRYAHSAPPPPPAMDAMEHFVFRSRRGACDLFASALALMCRAVDVPARVVTGYAPGEVDRELSTPDRQVFLVTEKHAHAWVEVYINPSWGWVPLDPTAGATDGERAWFTWLTRDYRLSLAFRSAKRNSIPVLLTVLILWSAVQLFRQPRSELKDTARRRSHRLSGARGEICRAYLKMCRLLQKHGVRRLSCQGPGEYLHKVEESVATLEPALVPYVNRITERFVRACYSNRPVYTADVYAMRNDLRELRPLLRRAPKSTRRIARDRTT